MNVLLAILWKDLVTEWRSRDRVVAMALFAALVVVIFHFALPARGEELRRAAPGLLWVAYVFAALLGFNRAFALELENEALAGLALAPADRGWIFLGKAIANFVLLGLVELLTAVIFALAFDLDLASIALPLALVAALGSAGLCTLGTLFAAVSVRTRYREVMLPLLLLPLLIPILLGAVRATVALFEQGTVPFEPLQLLVVSDGIFLVISFLAFDFILDE